ncbi:MAG: hypothetical protein FH751_11335 [Firmicutes bacterium]|nr:hypothetical protein [Bacillota bacterium]
MQVKDYITITISLLALSLSFCSIIFTYLNFKRSTSRLEIQQLSFSPKLFDTSARPNILYLSGEQNPDLWTVVPMLYLILYLKIDNLSHTGITISNVLLNDSFLVSKTNNIQLDDNLTLSFFSSEEARDRDFSLYGHAVPMSRTSLEPEHYNIIKIGERIESKSCIEGLLVVGGNQDLYNAVKEGSNKLTIVTPDKKFDANIKIYKTTIPDIGRTDKS